MYQAEKLDFASELTLAKKNPVQDPAFARLNAVSFVRSLARLRRNYHPETNPELEAGQGIVASRRVS